MHFLGTTVESLLLLRTAIFEEPEGVKMREKATRQQDAEGSATIVTRVSVNRTSLKDTAWVPAIFQETGRMPESLSLLGRPWIWRSGQGHCRHGPADWSAFGVGQFVFGYEGHSLLFIFNGQHLEQLGIPVTRAVERLEKMSATEFEEFLNGNSMVHCLLKEQSVAWVPYGHCVVAIGQTPGHSIGAFMPFFNAKMQGDANPSVMATFVSGIDDFLATGGERAELWATQLKPARDWPAADLSEEEPLVPAKAIVQAASGSAHTGHSLRVFPAAPGAASNAPAPATPLVEIPPTPPAKRARRQQEVGEPGASSSTGLAKAKGRSRGRGRGGAAALANLPSDLS